VLLEQSTIDWVIYEEQALLSQFWRMGCPKPGYQRVQLSGSSFLAENHYILPWQNAEEQVSWTLWSIFYVGFDSVHEGRALMASERPHFFFFFLAALGFELMASHLPNRHCLTA
jgi:hypothetical protein